jgi:hypothetical protein
MITIGVIVILNPQASAEERREKKKRAIQRRGQTPRSYTVYEYFNEKTVAKKQYFGSGSAFISVIASESRCEPK